jgi:hypothetical protein
VEAEMLLHGWPDYATAYQRVRFRQEMERKAQAKGWKAGGAEGNAEGSGEADSSHRSHDAEEEEAEEEASGFSELEEELLFEEFVRTFMGADPDRLSDSAYQKMFRDFKAKVLGGGKNARGNRGADEQASAARQKEGPSRLKELYRVLVRRLHPDMRADTDPDVSALWHEVQQAYADGNVERLEMLLAFTDMQAEGVGHQTTVGQMRAVLREIRSSLHALLRTLSGAKREMAWDFARNTNRAPLEQKLRRQMERDIAAREAQLRELEEFIGSWSVSARRRSRRRAMVEDEFWF